MAPTVVLVPGAGGVAAFWWRVEESLRGLGLPSVAVDLPGDDPAAGLPEYVEIVRGVVEARDDVVLVGQSIGGFTASWVADLVPVRRLVLLNAMIPVPGETAGQWWEATGQAEAQRRLDVAEGRDPDADFDVDVLFLHDVPPAVLDVVPVRDETDAVFAAPWGPSGWPDVPTRVVASTADRLFPWDFQQRVARERLGLAVESVPGGHLAALSAPDEVAAAIVHDRPTTGATT